MNAIKEFMYDESAVRTMVDNNNVVWFVGKDVATVLGYKNTNDALSRHVEVEDKNMGSQNTTPYITDSLGRKQYPLYINESGMYALILSSKLPSARKFKHWVTSEVLPNIREHGAHMTDAKIEEVLADPDTIIQLAMQLKESRAKQQEAETQVAILAPRAEYADKVLDSEGLLTSGDISKDFGMSAQAMNKILHENGVIYKQSKTWYVYSKYEHLNLMKLTTYQPDSSNYAPKMSKWTHQGYKFVVEFLQGLGYKLTNDEEA